MSLPKIAVKNYTTTLPVSKKRVTYRPFLVKEQKILLSAVEETRNNKNVNEVQSHLLNNFKNVMSNCIVSSKIDMDSLSVVDFNYLFLQIRIASSGESVTVMYTCECETKQEIKIHLDDIKVEFPSKELESTIQITDDVGIIIGLPKIGVTRSISSGGDNQIDKLVKIIASSITSIYDKENVYDTNTQTLEDVVEFVESIPTDKIEDIKSFFETVPYIEYKTKVNCPKKKETLVIREIEDFFL